MSNPAGMRRVARLAPLVPWRLVGAVTAAAIVLGAGWLWFRDSSFARVERVEVIGLSSSESDQVRDALDVAARGMTTLHVSHEDLDAAVERFTSVDSLRVQADFPHTLSIEVTEREPIAAVALGDGDATIPVGAGGRLMRGVTPERKLPLLHASGLTPGDRLTDPDSLAAVSVLAAAPEPLRERVKRVATGPKGLSLALRRGPQLFFGDAERPVAKWMATARVLAEPDSAGAVYLDVRVPERVAAGGLGELPETVATEPQVTLETDPTLEP